jgi:hypothetical protein
MSSRIFFFGGTTLPTRFIVYTYCAIFCPVIRQIIELQTVSEKRLEKERGKLILQGRFALIPRACFKVECAAFEGQ